MMTNPSHDTAGAASASSGATKPSVSALASGDRDLQALGERFEKALRDSAQRQVPRRDLDDDELREDLVDQPAVVQATAAMMQPQQLQQIPLHTAGAAIASTTTGNAAADAPSATQGAIGASLSASMATSMTTNGAAPLLSTFERNADFVVVDAARHASLGCACHPGATRWRVGAGLGGAGHRRHSARLRDGEHHPKHRRCDGQQRHAIAIAIAIAIANTRGPGAGAGASPGHA